MAVNVWAESIANLQRHRGPPLDMDIETGELIPVKMKVCKQCLTEKPETDFYLKPNKQYGDYYQTICKVCVCANERKRRPKSPRPERPYSRFLWTLAAGAKTLRDIYESMGLPRHMAQRMLYVLIAEGKVEPSGFDSCPQNHRIPMYRLTTIPADAGERNSGA